MSVHAARLARLEHIRTTLGPDYPSASECRDCIAGRAARSAHYRKVGGGERHSTKVTCRTCKTATAEMWDGSTLVKENRRKLDEHELRRARLGSGANMKFNGYGHLVGCVCGCER